MRIGARSGGVFWKCKRGSGRAANPMAGLAPAWYALLDLAFFVDNVLASDRIKLLDLEFVLAGARITSYNVCYTKLLRAPPRCTEVVASHRIER